MDSNLRTEFVLRYCVIIGRGGGGSREGGRLATHTVEK